MPTYAEKLRDPRWLRLKSEVMERDGHTCVMCPNKKELTVHHGYYEPKMEPWDYDMSVLWTLCWPCHQRAQQALGFIHSIFAEMHPINVVTGVLTEDGMDQLVRGFAEDLRIMVDVNDGALMADA